MNQSLKTSQIPHSVEAPLTFAIRHGAVLVSLPSRPGEGVGRYEGEHETRIVEITNAWPLADELSLDREDFQLVHHHTDVDFYDDGERETTYERETETLIRQATGAKREIVFDHTLRAGDDGTRAERSISPISNAAWKTASAKSSISSIIRTSTATICRRSIRMRRS